MVMNGFSEFPLFRKKMMFLYLNSYKRFKAKNKFSEKCKSSKVVKTILLTL